MSSRTGYIIQKIIQNVPTSVSLSDNTATIVSPGCGALQAGLVGGRVQSRFMELPLNLSVGTVVDAQTTESCVYVLNDTGSVFAYYNTGGCTGSLSEVYIPTECDGKAQKISAGKDHLLIWTSKNKVYGVGCNMNYQLVPQGQCRYNYAVEMNVTDYLTHNNTSTATFSGTVTEMNMPSITNNTTVCGKTYFVKQDRQKVYLGNLLTVTSVGYSSSNANNAPVTNGTLSLPLYVDVDYSGFIGMDNNGNANGNVSYNVSGIYAESPSSASTSTGVFTPTVGNAFATQNNVADIIQLTNEISTGIATISGPCGTLINVPLDLTLRGLLTVDTVLTAVGGAGPGANQQSVLSITLTDALDPTNILGLTTVSVLNGNYLANNNAVPSVITITGTPGFPINLDCCQTDCCPTPQSALPKKCWKNIFAGFDLSVLVDDCNSVYVFGSLHKVRDNAYLLKNTCLQDILSQATTTVTLPASQINCSTGQNGCATGCGPNGNKMNTDLNRIGIQLSFDPDSSYGLCDFLTNIQNCNAAPDCLNTCSACDNSVYLDIEAAGTNPNDTYPLVQVSNVILYNKRSLAKQVSSFSNSNFSLTPQYTTLSVTTNSILGFDANRYCIDGSDVAIDRPLLLTTPFIGGSTVVLYVDIDVPGGVNFSVPSDRTNNVRFIGYTSPTLCSSLNYGGILDPIILSNLKSVLAAYPTVSSYREYRNPPVTRLYTTYLQGGDCICFSANTGTQRLTNSVTADLPTLFRLNRPVLKVGVGNNSLSLLSGSYNCPSEILALGVNCNGQLGLGTRANAIVWKAVNRCYFKCPVTEIVGGDTVTFYLTNGGCVYGSGQWKNLVNSLIPVPVVGIPSVWKIVRLVVSKNAVLALGHDGGVYGMGENLMGELGTGNTGPVSRLTQLNHSNMSNTVMRQLSNSLAHPVLQNAMQSCATSSCCACPSDMVQMEPVTYTRSKNGVRSAKYIPNGRITYSQRWNK